MHLKMKLFPVYPLILCLVSPASVDSLDDDVPGCNCPGTICPAISSGWPLPHPIVCDLKPYDVNDIDYVGNENPICDTILESPEFQKEYGVNATGWYNWGLGDYGPYYDKSHIIHLHGIGTCEDVLTSQSNCTTPDTPSLNILAGGAGPYTQQTCSGSTFTTPMNETLTISMTCESWWNEDIINDNTPWKDNYECYVEMGDVDSICNKIKSSNTLTPVLTSTDWIEPKEGRRYMCKDVESSKGEDIFILLFSIGNEPCSGPPHNVDDPNPAAPKVRSSVTIAILSMIVGTMTSL